jgi:adenylate cyclase
MTEELFEAAILFTDMRRSSELATSTPTREFFRILNESLTVQGRIVREHGGRVLKYMGDGLMAVFRGDDRARDALLCACRLAGDDAPYSVGVADGPVMAGLVGDLHDPSHPPQPDVIGATVHLAARLCSMADAGEVLATRRLAEASGASLPMRDTGPLQVRGFASAIDCVSIVHDALPACAASSPPSS